MALPEDFVVREISAGGEVVSFSDESERLPTESERDAIVKKIEVEQKEKKQRFVFDDPPDWTAALKELITPEDFGNIEGVAKGQAQECFLQSPTEFRDRVYLQVCIQSCYPGLDTKIQKAESDEQNEVQQIQVLLDPVYKKFTDGGMTQENCECLLTFLRKGANDIEASKGVELKHDDTKEARTALHRLIAKNSSSFKTKTETRNGMQRLVVYFMPKTNKKRKRSEPQLYLRFVLQKTNQEHFACFDKLARQLHRPLSAFSYAGTKDKTAITYQHVVVTGVTPDRLLRVNGDESAATTSIRVGDLKYVEAPLSLGKAGGNRFSITIRNLSTNTSCTTNTIRSSLDSTLESITRIGFTNYFGFQRVGLPTNTVRAHHIGEKIIAEKWKEAVQLILGVQEGDSDDVAKAKQVYLEAGDVEAALKLMPQGMSVERQLLQGLKRYGEDSFEQAIQGLPFSRRVMYMHAYQSYLFNRVASYRLRHYGAEVVEGDLIHCGDEGTKEVKAVTATEASELNGARADALSLVLLPLPGTNVSLPSNATKDSYIKMMEQDGTKTALCESGPVKGAYRSLVSCPHDLEWTWQEEDNSLSLQLSFSLDSGCFATMCLREVLHSDI
ncbi:Pseudouridylate synthase 7 -like protein [Phytophthora citrophthora]|uniref:Pseudouridylate synthase 7 -like protein n=1 Tax=Phytophthora citrophthora TaxID=4793 RepID=A0AAD9LSE6_9STRA|nr:Pseudouridylate synthase 7 -like protein [Phytophthora citrophthora]